MPVSPGVAEAVVHVLRDTFDEPAEHAIKGPEVDAELTRLDEALHATKLRLRPCRRPSKIVATSSEAEIFETHLMILDDVTIIDHVRRTVRTKLINVDSVYHKLDDSPHRGAPRGGRSLSA